MKKALYQTILFAISTQFKWRKVLFDQLIGPYQALPLKRDDNEGVLCIPQCSSITRASPSDCFVSYRKNSLWESYPSAEMQSVYSVPPTDWAKLILEAFGHYMHWNINQRNKTYILLHVFGLIFWSLCLMTYRFLLSFSAKVIRRTVIILFNPYPGE